MKTKIILLAFCCVAMMGCNNNDPEKDKNNYENEELLEQLGDLTDGLGNITSSQEQQDGSIIMTDDKGNTITQDKEGNITIVMADGETILMDNSISEDPKAPKDKWYNSKWVANMNNIDPIMDHNYEKRQFVEALTQIFFSLDKQQIFKDSTEIYSNTLVDYEAYFRNTTVLVRQITTANQYTYEKTYDISKYSITPQMVGDDYQKYRLVLENVENKRYAVVYEDRYDYDYESETFFLMYTRRTAFCEVEADDAIYIENGYQYNGEKEEVLSRNVTTTFFNYRRLTDTQLAISNNTASFILKEESDSDVPEIDAFSTNGYHIATFHLVSL